MLEKNILLFQSLRNLLMLLHHMERRGMGKDHQMERAKGYQEETEMAHQMVTEKGRLMEEVVGQ